MFSISMIPLGDNLLESEYFSLKKLKFTHETMSIIAVTAKLPKNELTSVLREFRE